MDISFNPEVNIVKTTIIPAIMYIGISILSKFSFVKSSLNDIIYMIIAITNDMNMNILFIPYA